MKVYNRYLRACGVDVAGTGKYIHPSAYIDTGYAQHIHIGDKCIIGAGTVCGGSIPENFIIVGEKWKVIA